MTNRPTIILTTIVNGKPIRREVEPRTTLLEFVREHLGLTGAKDSCDVQVCGACTMLLNGEPVSSCCTLAYEAEGREVLTIEGVAQGENLHPIQQAFLEEYGLQCGFCTPGMILTSLYLLKEKPEPDEAEIKAALRGSLCRCTGYYPIINAIKRAASLHADQEPTDAG